MEIETKTLTAERGLEVAVMIVHPPEHTQDLPYPVGKFALLYSHGNAGTMAGVTHRLIRMSVELGVLVYAFEYPGK